MTRSMPTRPGDTTAQSVRSAWRWALAGGLLGASVALVVFAPASWLAAAVTSASHERVRLVQAQGTVWDGSALLELTGGAGSRDVSALPSRLHWQLRPSTFGLAGALHSSCCTAAPWSLAWEAGWASQRLRLGDGPLRWPAQLLSGLGTPWNTLQPEGDLLLQLRGLSLEWTGADFQLEGQAQLDALGLSSRLSDLRPLGSYRLSVTGPGQPKLGVTTLEGSLQLTAQGQFSSGQLHLTGQAQAAPGREAALSNLLNLIGRRSGERSLISIGNP